MKFRSSSLWVVLFFFQALARSTWAAPCCARNGATPALILGDDQIQLNLGFSLAQAVAEARPDGSLNFGNAQSSDQSLIYRLDSAFLLTDRLQIGAGLSVVQHQVSYDDQHHGTTGFGDSRVSLAYEALPVWTYSPWKPQIFTFTALTIPTGTSLYQSQDPLLADVTSNGFYALSVGGLILKRWNAWDAFLLPEVHVLFPRAYERADGTILVYPGMGGSFGIGGGWSPARTSLRIGLRVQPKLDQAVSTVTRDTLSRGKGMLSVCDTGFDLAYLLGGTDSLMFSYTDQTLLGVAMNQNVNRTAVLTYQHRWER